MIYIQTNEAIQETIKDVFVDALPPELKKIVKAHKKHRKRLERESRQQQTQAQLMNYQMETESTLQRLLEHSKKIQENLDEEKTKKEAAEKKAHTWQIVSLILAIISIALAVIPFFF